MQQPMIFIHGAWLAANSFENFEVYFASRGYDVQMPNWPRRAVDVGAQRAERGKLVAQGVSEVVQYYATLIGEMTTPPVIVGHSYGGLLVQMLLDEGLGAAGVAMSPSPPKGVYRVTWSRLRACAPALTHPGRHNRPIRLTSRQFRYAYANTMSKAEARRAYERYAVPDSSRLLLESTLATLRRDAPKRVNFRNPLRAPLLITTASRDHAVPPVLARANYCEYQSSTARTDFVEFPDRSHLLMLEAGWETVATRVANWLSEVLLASRDECTPPVQQVLAS